MADDDAEEAFAASDAAAASFRRLVRWADREFASLLNLLPYGRVPEVCYRKVTKAYTRLWDLKKKYGEVLAAVGLRRWEIGEIAYRIGQLYYVQYLQTSEARFLIEAYLVYEAILERGYFKAGGGRPAVAGEWSQTTELELRKKELRFHVRFLTVALLLNRMRAVQMLVDRFSMLVSQITLAFPETNLKEWNHILQEIIRFLDVDTQFVSARPLRYNVMQDAYPSSLAYFNNLRAKRVLRLQYSLLACYHRDEVKFAELTLDNFRMIQCLECEPGISFYQFPSNRMGEYDSSSDQNEAFELLDVNIGQDVNVPTLPSNPRKAVIHRQSVSHLISVLGGICEELSSDGILLIYISAPGKAYHNLSHKRDVPGSSKKKSLDHGSRSSFEKVNFLVQPFRDTKMSSSSTAGSYINLRPRENQGANYLYPEDLVPFTRWPLFIIIDSNNSHAFKDLHGAEREEKSALLFSPEKTSSTSDDHLIFGGSQFTYFLTAPLQAFCQLSGLYSDIEIDAYDDAESLLASALAEWELELCKSDSLDQVWSQVLPDPFLRRLIVRFIFCRAVLFCLHPAENETKYLPKCLPDLPNSVSPESVIIQRHTVLIAERLDVDKHFPYFL